MSIITKMTSPSNPYSDDMLAKIEKEHHKKKCDFSKEDLIGMKKVNEERKKINQKMKKLSREEDYKKYWRWDINNPQKNKVKCNENIVKKTEIEVNTKNNTIKNDNIKPRNTNRKLSDPSKGQTIIAEDHSNKSVFDEEGNPIDPVAYVTKATGKSYGNTMSFSSKVGEIVENNRVHNKKGFDLNSIEDLHKVCDRERDYVHELQKILFSYYLIDIEKTEIALGKIDDKDGKIHELFKKEIGNGLNGRLDFFHWWEISSVNFDFIIDTVIGLHKGLEKVKEEINKKIKNPEDKLPIVRPFYNGIHEHSPRNKKQ